MSLSESTTSAWVLYTPDDSAPWNLERVVHLHRRAGFAANWDRLQQDLTSSPQVAVGRLLAGKLPSPANDQFESLATTIGDAAVASGSPNRLKAWWLYRMLQSPDPLGERLTLMWHNHFATSNRKVQNLAFMRGQNDRLREHARGPFGKLLSTAIRDPAMLVWLDADANHRGHPNENLARESMELFTLGVGNYTENDVQEAARALTGWTIVEDQFQVKPQQHDEGPKTVLGRTGRFDGDQLIGILLEQSATSRRIARRICKTFLGEAAVGDDKLDALATGLREHDLDVGWAVETVLRSQQFFAADSLRTRISGPVEWMVGALQALELCQPPPSTLLMADWAARMGQDLFYPPNVGGWAEGQAWLGSRSMIARANFAAALTSGQLWYPARPPDLSAVAASHRPTNDLAPAVSRFAELLWGRAPDQITSGVLASAKREQGDRCLATAVTLLLAHPESQLT